MCDCEDPHLFLTVRTVPYYFTRIRYPFALGAIGKGQEGSSVIFNDDERLNKEHDVGCVHEVMLRGYVWEGYFRAGDVGSVWSCGVVTEVLRR
jgi:hypothetical protein